MPSSLELEPGKTLLLDGPASATLSSGLVSVFGAEVGPRRRLVVRKGRRLPLEALEPSQVDITVGLGGSFSVVEGSPIPRSWHDVVEEALAIEGSARLLVLGAVDVGKTSLCTFLANRALKAGRSVGIVDADVGQSDIGPPCTMGFAKVEEPTWDLSTLRAEHIFFFGDKTPSHLVGRALKGMKIMLEAAERSGVDFLIVNTDGWISGPEAAEYKKALASIVDPHLVLALRRARELDLVLRQLGEWEVRPLDISPFVKERDRETRRELRTLGYRRYLDGAKVISVNLKWVEVEGEFPGSGLRPSRERCSIISSVLGFEPLYCEEGPKKIFVILREEDEEPDPEAISRLENVLGKKVEVLRKGFEKGTLVALYDKEGAFLGIGIIMCVDYRKRTARIFTLADEEAVARMCIGRVKLNPDGTEMDEAPDHLNPPLPQTPR